MQCGTIVHGSLSEEEIESLWWWTWQKVGFFFSNLISYWVCTLEQFIQYIWFHEKGEVTQMNMQHLTLACLETTCLSPTWCFCCKKKCFQCKILRITKYIKYIQSTIIKSTVFSLSISVLCSVLQNSIYMFIFSSYFSTEQFSCSFLSFGLKNMDSNIRPCFVSFIWTQQTHRSLNISGFRYWCTASSLSWQVYWLHCMHGMHGKSLAVTQVLIVRQRCVCLWYYKDAEMCNVNGRCKADCKSSREIIMVTVYDAFLFANISRQTLRSW